MSRNASRRHSLRSTFAFRHTRLKKVVLVSTTVFVLMSLVRLYLEHTSFGRDLEDLQYSTLQTALRGNLAARHADSVPHSLLSSPSSSTSPRLEFQPLAADRSHRSHRARGRARGHGNAKAIGIDI